MEENQDKEFQLTWALLVTGFSFGLFGIMLNLIDGQNVPLFWWIGGTSFALGLITGAITLITRGDRVRH